MRPNNANNRRSRGRGGRKSGNSRNQTFDSNGPGARVRGNASQIYEKYQQLARDASSSSDRVGAENFLQHAEHYYRLMIANGPRPEQRNNADGSQDDASDGNEYDSDSDSDAESDQMEASSDSSSSDDGSDDRRDADGANGNGPKPAPRKRRPRKPRNEEADSSASGKSETSEETEVSPA